MLLRKWCLWKGEEVSSKQLCITAAPHPSEQVRGTQVTYRKQNKHMRRLQLCKKLLKARTWGSQWVLSYKISKNLLDHKHAEQSHYQTSDLVSVKRSHHLIQPPKQLPNAAMQTQSWESQAGRLQVFFHQCFLVVFIPNNIKTGGMRKGFLLFAFGKRFFGCVFRKELPLVTSTPLKDSKWFSSPVSLQEEAEPSSQQMLLIKTFQ